MQVNMSQASWLPRLCLGAVVASLAAAGAPAAAQPQDEEEEETGARSDAPPITRGDSSGEEEVEESEEELGLPFDDEGAEETEPSSPAATDKSGAKAPPAPPAPARSPAPDPAATEDRSDGGTARPFGFSLGVGAGYDLPADLRTPDTISVRFRLPSGIAIEPRLVLSTQQNETEFMGSESTDGLTEVGAAASARLPVMARGPVDLVLVGGAGLSYSVQDPDGPDNETRTTSIGLFWGLGVEYWLSQHWSINLTATNPFVTFQRTTTELAAGEDMTQETRSIGLVFDPDVFALVHLYF